MAPTLNVVFFNRLCCLGGDSLTVKLVLPKNRLCNPKGLICLMNCSMIVRVYNIVIVFESKTLLF